MTSYTELTFKELLADSEIFVDGDWIESKDQDQHGNVRLIQLADIGDGFYIDKSARFLTKDTAMRLKCTFLKEGDILIARMPDPLGRACIFPNHNIPCITVVDICIIRPNLKKIYNRWLMHAINSPFIRQQINEYVTGTTRKRISRGNLSKIKIFLPPLEEQRRIAAILDQADELRQKRQEAINKLDELLQATFIDMFGDPIKNPKKWERTIAAKFLKIQNGYAFPSKNFTTDGIPVIKIGNANKNGFNTEKLDFVRPSNCEKFHQYELKAGDLLLSLTGTVGKDDYGNITEVSDEYDTYYLNQRVAKIDIDNNIVMKNYIKYLFSQKSIKYYLTKNNRGIRQANINNSDIYNLTPPIPPMVLQQKWNKIVNSIEDQKQKLQEQLEQQNNLFHSLQQQAFNGTL